MSDFKVYLIVIGAVIVCALAAQVGEQRAKAMAECYKAAQINHSIKCEVPND